MKENNQLRNFIRNVLAPRVNRIIDLQKRLQAMQVAVYEAKVDLYEGCLAEISSWSSFKTYSITVPYSWPQNIYANDQKSLELFRQLRLKILDQIKSKVSASTDIPEADKKEWLDFLAKEKVRVEANHHYALKMVEAQYAVK